MGKKNYLIIGVTTIIFITIIITIIMTGSKKNNSWINNIKNSENYSITMVDCNGREKNLEKEVLSNIEKNLKKASNNGPWTGDSSICYTKLNFSYENNAIINEADILIIDKNSIVLDLGTSTIYYTNSEELINYLNAIFKNQKW